MYIHIFRQFRFFINTTKVPKLVQLTNFFNKTDQMEYLLKLIKITVSTISQLIEIKNFITVLQFIRVLMDIRFHLSPCGKTRKFHSPASRTILFQKSLIIFLLHKVQLRDLDLREFFPSLFLAIRYFVTTNPVSPSSFSRAFA